MDFWSAACTALGAAGEGEALRDCVVHHQAMPISNSKSNAIPAVANLRPLGRDPATDFVTIALRCSHGRTIRNRSIGTEMFRIVLPWEQRSAIVTKSVAG